MFMQYFPSIWQERHVVYCRDQGVTRDVRLARATASDSLASFLAKFSSLSTLRMQFGCLIAGNALSAVGSEINQVGNP